MRSARACIGWQILSANKTGKAERRLNKRAVSDRNVRDYLRFAGRCGVVSGIWGKGCGRGGRRWGGCVSPFVLLFKLIPTLLGLNDHSRRRPSTCGAPRLPFPSISLNKVPCLSLTPRGRLFQAFPSKDQVWFNGPSRTAVPPDPSL